MGVTLQNTVDPDREFLTKESQLVINLSFRTKILKKLLFNLSLGTLNN